MSIDTPRLFRVAFIGAGSIGFTRTLLRDMLAVPEFAQIEVAFTDIDPDNLDRVARLCRRDIAANGLSTPIIATTDRREALRGARYVVNCTRIGGLDAFTADIDIPLRYGVDQCVGDTLCAGGILYGQRGIAALLDFCRDIREVAEPDCLLLNYANPLAQLTWAAHAYGGVRCVGLCHGVQGSTRQIAEVATHWGRRHGWIGSEEAIAPADLQVTCAGINHQTWFLKVSWGVRDLVPLLLEMYESHPRMPTREKVRIDMMRRFGYYSTESNGHLSEYVPWYRKHPDTLADWIDPSWGLGGETGGYLRGCIRERNWFETDFPKWMEAPPWVYAPAHRSVEHGSWIIEGLETGRTYRGHFNVPNGATIPNLPPDCMVEVPCYANRHGIQTPSVGELPWGCAAVCQASINVQRLAVLAAVSGDDRLLRQAVLLDPLVGAVCTPPEVWQMVDELLVAEARWLPQYAQAIATAKERLAKGLAIPVREGYRGAVRPDETASEGVERAREALSAKLVQGAV